MTEKVTVNTEQIFQLVNSKDWKEIIEIFRSNSNYNFIINEPILKPLIDKYFIEELLTSNSMKDEVGYKHYLSTFHILHSQQKFNFKLSDENFKRLILKIVEIETDLTTANNYAELFPNEEICKSVIEQFQKNTPKVINHSQENNIYVTENKNIQSQNATISLFKSKQEYEFYKAVRNVYQSYLVLPNVSLNAIINFDLIKEYLTTEERKYFFVALIDCVIIDTEENYNPIKFFELDSFTHDNNNQILKDKMKDNIFAVAGQKLMRIRRTTKKQSEEDFSKLIREIIK